MNKELQKLKLKYPKRHIDTFHNYIELHCNFCHKDILIEFLENFNAKNRYCSYKCSYYASAKMRKNRNKAKRYNHTNCVVCNSPIIQNQLGRFRKYCSNRCKKIIYNRKVKEKV